ncbi:(2Fe-2S)-binding protein [Chromobacterium sp. IIBBL 290-4]|uniref:(2Fe-2S)-binding protein n=1 Tax=Chromobacterium sp. IIBBL 290-4 TaxID=2953890 RepID=UPI0020B70E4D|nr:(2Fe-2S)-binding protein [Chromobacterium sp. IIBBL 290-4]UTH72851.1 (2Fe-2S)-binding protein [Chromobacterium sp. IIBBL 290-4]
MSLTRQYDIQPLIAPALTIYVNDAPIAAAAGETVLSVLSAAGLRRLSRNDNLQTAGSYCGMGICHCCQVRINGRHKLRACQTIVEPGMRVETDCNRLQTEGL